MNPKKVFFVENEFRIYRLPFFKELNKYYDLNFLMTRETDSIKDKNTAPLKYELLSYYKIKGKYGICLPVIPRLLLGKCDAIITGSQHLFESYAAFFIAKLRRKPFILWSETWDWPRKPLAKLLNPLIYLMTKYADACVCTGKKSKEYFIKFGAKPKNIFIIPDTTLKYDKIKNKKRLKINLKNKKVILYISRIVPYKGLDFLIKAFAKLKEKNKDVILIIGGDGSFKEYTQQLVKKLNVKDVCFIGWVKEDEKAYLFSLGDVFVLPSTFRDYDGEAWGLVLNEAMGAGLPVISTTAVGGSYDLIKNGVTGYMVEHADTDALYKALKEITSNNSLRKKMGSAAKKLIEDNYSFEKMANGFKKAIDYTLKKVKP